MLELSVGKVNSNQFRRECMSEELQEVVVLLILEVFAASVLIVAVEEGVGPDAVVPDETASQHGEDLVEVDLVSQHPQHVVEAKAHLSLQQVLRAQELQDLLVSCM